MKPKISFICLGVSDVERSLRFYRDGLGFPTHGHEEGADHVLFALEGSWLSIYPRASLAEDAGVADDRPGGFSGVTLEHNVASEAEVERVCAEALAAGARLVKPPQSVFWGGYHAYVADPDGQFWEIAFNPYTDLT